MTDIEDPVERYYLENDDSFKPGGVWRVVPWSARQRYKRLGTSARPPYVATVYDEVIARRIVEALNQPAREEAVIRVWAELAERDRLIAKLRAAIVAMGERLPDRWAEAVEIGVKADLSCDDRP